MSRLHIALAFVLALVALTLCSQDVKASVTELPVTTVNGRNYYYYEVQPKETIYSLTHKFGISIEEMFEANPSLRDGLKAHQVLYFPVDGNDGAAVSIAGTHTVVKGETIYGISQKYGITSEELVALNPSLKDGLKAGETLIIAQGQAVKTMSQSRAGKTHLVQEGETLFSIARANGITVEQLEAANPAVTVLKQGQVINIPEAVTESETRSEAVVASEPAEEVAPVVEKGETRIAVILPFMLKQSPMPKAAARHLEFYKGFLLAVDSLRNSGNALKIYAYDTAGSTDTVAMILKRPELRKMHVIVAPDDDKQLEMIARYCRQNEIAVFNAFLVKDTTYVSNPMVIQANISSEQMYSRAETGMLGRLNGAVPVFLKRQGGATDKAEFVQLLQAEMRNRNIAFKTLTYSEKLKDTDLAKLTAGDYVFIPESGRASEAGNYLSAMNAFRDKMLGGGGDVKLWGYPEWTTFKGEMLEGIKSLNALIYSRFSDDAGAWDATIVNAKYSQWYGGKMSEDVPSQGLLGFDVGMFLVKSLSGAGKSLTGDTVPTYRGVQNSYMIGRRGDCKGLSNNALYLINYRPSGLVENYLLP